MNLFRKSRIDACQADPYATSEDFSRLFTEDMSRLYLLSFVLTADHEKAELCFVGGLEDCVRGNLVFKEWARSWAERAVLKNAIRMVAPHPNRADESFTGIHPEARGAFPETQDQQAAIARVLALGDFDRFVFVMSVLERYSDKECSVLLGCLQQDVREARMRAQQQIADDSIHDVAVLRDSIQSSSRSLEMPVH